MAGKVANCPDDLLRELKKLRTASDSVEKEIYNDICGKKNINAAGFNELESIYGKLAEEYNREKSTTIHRITKIRGSVLSFLSAAADAKNPQNRKTPSVINSVKSAMDDVENQVSAFKELQSGKFSDLASEEKILEQEIFAMDRKIEMWNRTNFAADEDMNKKPMKVPVAADRDVIKDLPPEIAQFQLFLDEHGGNNGGWDSEDHELFLKQWSRLKDDNELLASYVAILPTRTEAEIMEHIKWYRQFQNLLAVKKAAISKWKEEKSLQQKSVQKSREEKEREAAEKAALDRAVALEEMEIDRINRRQQLNAWKVERELDRLRKEEEKTRDLIEREIKEERNRLQHLETKAKLKMVLQERQRKLEFEKKLAEKEKLLEEQARKEQIEASRPRVELRNEIFLKEKQELELKKKVEKLERQQRIKLAAEKLKPEVPSDPSRVLQPTKVWKHRVRSAEPSVNRNVPPNFSAIPHRAIPTWRQGPV